MTVGTPSGSRVSGLFPAAATATMLNVAVFTLLWFATAGDGWFRGTCAALVVTVTVLVALGLGATPRWRRSGSGVLPGTGVAIAIVFLALCAVGMAIGS